MGKRKRSEEEINRKVRRLEKKLLKYRRRRDFSSGSESDGTYRNPYIPDEEYQSEEDLGFNVMDDERPVVVPALVEAAVPTAPPSPSDPAGTSTGPSATAGPSEEVQEVQDLALDPEILQMLGDDPSDEKSYGEDLHKDIATRWTNILINGLTREAKMNLLKEYLPPENCCSMRAPKLNPEIKAALTEPGIIKDLYSQSKQSQLSSSLAAIGKALNWAISKQVQEIIKPLSDAARLLCDYQYRESQSRRYAIVNTLNKQTRDTIKDTKIDEYLFGSHLAEQIKSSKASSKSGLELKAQRPPFKQPPPTQVQRGALNLRGAARAAVVESRRNPAPRRPMTSVRDRRHETTYRGNSSRGRMRRR